jgi:flagellar hook-length control protein FliK
MTTPVSSSSILLLSGTGAAPTASDAIAAQPSSDGAASGFQLLLSALADQQALTLKAPMPVNGEAGDVDAAAADPTGGGSALPITGIFMPLLGAQTATAKTEAVSTEQKKDSSSEQSDDQSAQISLLLTPASVVVPTAPANQPAPTSTTADDLVAELAALTSFAGNGGVKPDKAAATPQRSETTTSAMSTDGESADTALSSKSIDAKNLIAAAATAEPSRSNEGTDFGALLKQLDSTTAPSNNGSNVTALSSVHDPRSLANAAGANNAVATVSVPVGGNGWSDAVADKVMWFSANKINSAEIHLNPSDLGPVQVRISTQNDQTTVAFSSPHAAVRDALDHALPRLRDMMGGQGIQLLDVSVGGQGAERQQHSRGENNFTGTTVPSYFTGDGDGAEPIAVTSVNVARLSRSAVDAYV